MYDFVYFQNQFDLAINCIKDFQEDPDLGVFTNWLLETDINPYSLFNEDVAHQLSYAEGFCSVLRAISHALYDDGDICFPVVKNQPKMIFSHQLDYETIAEGEFLPEIIFLSSLTEFMEKATAHQRDAIKRAFMHDYGRFGLDFAKAHYSHYRDFDAAWIDEVSNSG